MKMDETTIGSILIKMGALNDDQLFDAIEAQERSSTEMMLGNLLVAYKICTKEQIDMALAAQKGLRSELKVDKALATADIAAYRKRHTNGQRMRAMERAKSVNDGYPAVMAAKPSDG